VGEARLIFGHPEITANRRRMPAERFVKALNDQVANELAASHQYVAIGAHYESQTLPQLARFFYAQAVEERGHAMMMIKYLLDTDAPVMLREVAGPTTKFEDHIAPIRMALEQERKVSGQISELFAVAREEHDYLSEQFVQWFLKEQVEEEATMTEILDVAERVRDLPMTLEEYIARENPGGEHADALAPPAAGAAE
jgi:bacterioferritin B